MCRQIVRQIEATIVEIAERIKALGSGEIEFEHEEKSQYTR